MDFNTFINRFPIKLNDQQREAVQAVNGPVLLLAVPGSGKTTVLVARLGYMIFCCGIDPAKILVLTYTVAATNDMKKRFAKLFGEENASRIKFRTINSICQGIIKTYGRMLGKEPFSLENDEKKLLMIISLLYQKYEHKYPEESDLNEIKTMITYIKNMMLSDEEIKELEKESGYSILKIYKGYCSELRRQGLMDYDDQMVYAYNMLSSDAKFLEYCQNSYPYICVDEAQDTSKIQHEIIALLAAKTKNIFMVGDEDQSIYGFRAAYPEALLSFEQNYSGAKVLLMEQNFRSNAKIVEAADRFIQKNKLRHKKQMIPTRSAGADIREIKLSGRDAQYEYLLRLAEKCESQTAVLYRENESIIPLIDLLERNNLPYRIRNAEMSFFSNRLVMDIQDILRYSKDIYNTDLFEKIYYKISTYLSKTAAGNICALSRKNGSSVFEETYMYPDVKQGTINSMQRLEAELKKLSFGTPLMAINRIISSMGYGEYMERTGLRNTKAFVLKSIAKRTATIDEFLLRLEELKQIIQDKENDYSCPFILSTIHGSKGLEYDNVYMIDLIDGIFPEETAVNTKQMDKKELEAYEEERRIFYVGATRAKENLFLLRTSEESSFIRQLLEESISENDIKKFKDGFSEGMAVTHKRFGEGTITAIKDRNISILFHEKNKLKTFDLNILIMNKLLSAK
ncbi:MAG: ATP-dependent helicase [Eubacteriales bacterium]|nr:ATP-dependent helicase [Eubacteriales bacterium]